MKDVAELLREQRQKTEDLRTEALGRLQGDEEGTKARWKDMLQAANADVMDSARKAAANMQGAQADFQGKKARMEALIARLSELRGQLSGSVSSDPELSKLRKELTDLKTLSENLVTDFKEKAQEAANEVYQEMGRQQELIQNKAGEAYAALQAAGQALESYGA